MTALNKQALRQTAEKAQEHGVFNMDIHSQTVLALLDELEAAEKRIAELEAREVVLPRSFNREIFGEGMYEVPNGNWMHRKDVTEALLAAGIITKVGE
ncbi:TPA: ead/Ea22-like family protein [Escherichia coli]